MSISADTRATPAFAANQVAAAADKLENVRFGMRTRTVLVYLTLAAIALTPGLWLWLLPEVEIGNAWADQALAALRHGLQDIHFGGGMRFWFGVTGLTMMVLLLLYPARKAMAKRRWLGSIGGWFHVHMIFGIGGPVLILYHCNFGRGAPDANVALWSMLAVAASGIVGHFIYASVSATFYANKQAARAQLDAINATLAELDAMHPSRQQLQNDLETFDAELLTPRRGIYASLAARFRIERRRSALVRAIGWHIDSCAEQLRLSEAEQIRLRSVVGTHFWTYMRMARHAATRSVREQIWARWRLFHLPAFLIMVVAAGLHVAAVWNLDDKSALSAQPARDLAAPLALPSDPTRAVARPKPVENRATQSLDLDGIARLLETLPANGGTAAPKVTVPPALKTEIREATRTPAPTPKAVLPQPKPAARPLVSVDSGAEKAERAPIAPAAAEPERPATTAKTPAAAAPDAIAELQRREGNPMSLGGAKPRTLVEQIAELKQKQKSKQFAHALTETGFALTGKHLKLDCAACHTAPFREPIKPSASPRACIDCHKKDDVHRGRRENCASCHTTKNWADLIRQ